MNEILDHDFEELPKKNTFAKLSFGLAMISLVLITHLSIAFMDKIKVSAIQVNILEINGLRISILAGFFCSIMSLVRKEKLKYFRNIGIVLNFAYFILVIVAIFFAAIFYAMGE